MPRSLAHLGLYRPPGISSSTSILWIKDSLSPDGQIAWNVYDHINVYDKLRTDIISGKYGSAALNYVVMSDAAEALVEVILINGGGTDPANVYGRILLPNSSFDGEIESSSVGQTRTTSTYARMTLSLC